MFFGKILLTLQQKMKIMSWKFIYCSLWSVGLFFATFFGLVAHGNAVFDFTDKQILPVAETLIMPMIMAWGLYLWDVLYTVSKQTGENRKESDFWMLLMIIIFLVCFVFSIIVNQNAIGWILFLVSWVALTVLKYKTMDEEQGALYEIMEN